MVRYALAFGVVVVGVAVMGASEAAETFRQLKGKEIADRLTGMEFTDGVHWAHVFKRRGSLSSVSMGKKETGAWRIEKNELCLDWPCRKHPRPPASAVAGHGR